MRVMSWRSWGTAIVSAFVLVQASVGATTTVSSAETLRPAVGDRVMRYIEAETEGHFGEAITGYTALLETDRLSPFEQATILQLRGRVWYALDDSERAVTDWREAINLDALPVDAANTLRLNTGQLLLALGAYRDGVFMIETALTLGAESSPDIAMRLAQGYGQLQDFASGLRWAERAFETAEPRLERHYSLLLFYYQSLDMQPQQLRLVREMVDRWPDEKRYWTSLTALLALEGLEAEAFEVNTVMYLNGLLTESPEILRLAQYYAFYEYPFRGADILQRELNSGRVEPDPANYRLLAALWRQAREWDRALPVLRRVATTTGHGPDYEALGEALYQRAEYREAEAMFLQALDRGGMSRPGDTWTLIGNARYEQDRLTDAIAAFEQGLRHDYSRATAQGWIDFIEHRIAIENQGESFIHQTTIDGCENWIIRARREVVIDPDELDPDGRRRFNLPVECTTYFDAYGLRLPEWEDV